jgi:F-type H+-transporting ATPase subunit epsilon
MATATTSSDSRSIPSDGRLRCVVVTPERKVLEEVADSIVLPLYDGELGVLPRRAPLIGRLGQGELRIRTGDSTSRFFVEGGFAQVREDVVTILTGRAIPVSQLDGEAARRDYETARNRVARSEHEIAEREAALQRARVVGRLTAKRS